MASLQKSVPGFAPPNYNTIAPNINIPTYYEWNFEIQRALNKAVTLSVNYVGNHGSNEILQNLYENGYAANGFGGLPTTAPDPRFGESAIYIATASRTTTAWWLRSVGMSAASYRVLSATRGRTHWMSARTAVWNRSTANSVVSLRYQISPSIPLNYSSSDYDVRHSFNANYVYSPKVHVNNCSPRGCLAGGRLPALSSITPAIPSASLDSGVRGANGVGNLAESRPTPSSPTGMAGATVPELHHAQHSLLPCLRISRARPRLTSETSRAIVSAGPGYFDTDSTCTRSSRSRAL